MSDTHPATGSDLSDDTRVSHSPPRVSLAEAVEITGVSRSTLQRRLKAGEVEGATRKDDGGWSIPVPALIAAGMAPKVSPPDPVPALEAQLEATREQLRAVLTDLQVLRAESAAQARNLDDLRQALDTVRALTAGASAEVPPRRRWLRNART